MINQVSILGNLATAPGQNILPSGTVKVSFLLAFNSYYTDRAVNPRRKLSSFGLSALDALLSMQLSTWL